MSEFAPPTGPPPPKVPEGWKAVWNDQYKEWFYVNLHTKQSTWEKPSEPASKGDPGSDAPPPTYSAGSTAPTVSDTKKPLDSNNPYNSSSHETDEQMARRLQAEEEARIRGGGTSSIDRGASDSYYNTGAGTGAGSGSGSPYQAQQQGGAGGYPSGIQQSQSPSNYPQQSTSSDKGLFGKLKNKLGGGSSSRPPQAYGGGMMGGGGYPQQPGYGYPQQGYGGGYGGGGPPMQYGGYGQQPMYAQQPARRTGGIGAGGAAALGVGGGLVGGMLLADAMEDHDQHEYQDGYQDGQQNGGDYGGGGGGDYGGGDYGGGDGGDFGGGGDF